MVIEFWILIAVLTLCAIAWIAWPLLREQKSVILSQNQVNVDLYRQRLNELKQQFADGHVSKDQFELDKQQLAKHLIAENQSSGSFVTKAQPAKYLALRIC